MLNKNQNPNNLYQLLFLSGYEVRLVNLITLYRVLAAPVLLYYLLTNQLFIFKWMLLISFVTDAIDGYLARKLNATTSNANNSITEATISETAIGKSKTLTQQEANTLVKRVYEIRTIKINTLSVIEKADLKNELLNIQEQLNNPALGGIYISVGALVLIIVLLIVLF